MKHSTSRSRQRRRFLLPASLMLAALLVGLSTFKPALFTSNAAADGQYRLVITADSEDVGGDFTITVNNDASLSTSFDEGLGEDDKQIGETKTTYSIFLDGSCDFTISAANPITSVSFGENKQFITGIHAYEAGLTDVNVSGLTNLTKLDIPDIPLSNAYALSYSNEDALEVSVKAPAYEATEDGVAMTLPALDEGADVRIEGDMENPDKHLTPQANGQYLIAYDDLDVYGVDNESGKEVFADVTKGNVTFRFMLVVDGDDIPGYTPPAPDEPSDPDDPDDPFEHIGAFGPAKNSEKILLSVGIDNETVVKNGSQEVPLADVRAAVKAPSDKEKKAFLEAIKKADKDFAATDNDLMVYEVYLTDEKGNTLTVAEGSVTSILVRYAFPASQLYSNEYNYKVYQQLANKSAASIDTLQKTAHGLNFYTETLGLFAIARTPIPIEYTDLTIREDSRNIIKAAQIDKTASLTQEDGASIDLKDVSIAAIKPSDADKKTFLEAIQKTDKDFKADDKNLMVYDICLVDKDGKDVYSNKFIKITLSYPNDTVAKSYNGYTYKVYHDHGETLDTKITATGGKDGITFSSREFSLYAISSTVKQSGGDGNPGTGETNALTVIAFALAALSVIGFAVVYTKNKAEQV